MKEADRWHRVRAAFGLGALVMSCVTQAAAPVTFTAAGDFSEAAVLRGVAATQAACEAVANAVWVSTLEHGQACIKYWAAGFKGRQPTRAVVFFHGDIFIGMGKTSPVYLGQSNQKLQRSADSRSAALAAPYVFVGRPGTHGSSGDHMQRRRPAESALLSAALDKIKQRLHITELVLAGQSGGGHVTAALLSRRADVVCAVPTSAPSSPRIRWTLRGLKRDTTGFVDSYEPTEHLSKAALHPALRVFVLGDPDDSNVLWPSQTALADRLAAIGAAAVVLRGHGAGPEQHGLPNSAHKVAGWCHHDLATGEIVRRATKGLSG